MRVRIRVRGALRNRTPHADSRVAPTVRTEHSAIPAGLPRGALPGLHHPRPPVYSVKSVFTAVMHISPVHHAGRGGGQTDSFLFGDEKTGALRGQVMDLKLQRPESSSRNFRYDNTRRLEENGLNPRWHQRTPRWLFLLEAVSGDPAGIPPGAGPGAPPARPRSRGPARTVHVVLHHHGELQLRSAAGSQLQHPQGGRDAVGGDDDVVPRLRLDDLIENLDSYVRAQLLQRPRVELQAGGGQSHGGQEEAGDVPSHGSFRHGQPEKSDETENTDTPPQRTLFWEGGRLCTRHGMTYGAQQK